MAGYVVSANSKGMLPFMASRDCKAVRWAALFWATSVCTFIRSILILLTSSIFASPVVRRFHKVPVIHLHFHTDIHQCLFLIQQNKVQTEILRIQQNIPAGSLLLLVHRFVLQSSLPVAGNILSRKIKTLRSNEFRTVTTFDTITVKEL